MSIEAEDTGVRTGEFPFPISDGPSESRYLTWIRNHSSYMAVRGLLDYFRAVAVLARGALVNALVGLPFLLVVAVLVAMLHVLPLSSGFIVTPWVLYLGVAAVALFPFFASLLKIVNFRRSLGSGSDSSVKLRDRWERLFGVILLAIVAVAAFEAMPAYLDRFHFWAVERRLQWPEVVSAFGALIAAYTAANRLFSLVGGLARKIAFVAVGALGLLIPLLVVLYVADFLVFTRPDWQGDWGKLPLAAAVVICVGIALVMLVGLLTRAFSFKEFVWVSVLLGGSVYLASFVSAADDEYLERVQSADTALWSATRELSKDKALEKEVGELLKNTEQRPEPELTALAEHARMIRDWRKALDLQSPPPIDSAAPLDDQLTALADLADSADLPEAAALVAAVRAKPGQVALGEADALTNELDHLRVRVTVLHKVFDERSPRDLLVFVFRDEEQSLETLLSPQPIPDNPDGAAYPYPLLSSNYADELRAVNSALDGWYFRLEDVRLEAFARAVFSPTNYPGIYKATAEARVEALWPKVILVLVIAVLLWWFCWLTVDVNLTSIHGLYRDRLASAFLIGADTGGDVDIEQDLDLADLGRHEAGSTAPYHLINVALNLQGSRDIGIRDRHADYFVFSKRFTGGQRTGYCRSEAMERVFPSMSLSTAMAISAAAASPNMGRATSPALVALMTLLNVRLGIWVPNPGLVHDALEPQARDPGDDRAPRHGLAFADVFREELAEVQRRWEQLPDGGIERRLADEARPTVRNGLVGIGYSGGGIRSATLNLGITQALHRRGVFDHLDYMSTVSGGGYLGSSLSALMRRRVRTESEVSGRVAVQTQGGHKVVTVTPSPPGLLRRWLRQARAALSRRPRRRPQGAREYRYAGYARLDVAEGSRVKAGQRLLAMGVSAGRGRGSFGEQFRWRVRPTALLREMLGRLDETYRWVNVSDGGHIENLACIELLRRRCRYILVGDGEADPRHGFNGLATLIRSARIDLGVHIDIDVDALRLNDKGLCREHWAVGRVHYPGEAGHGYLLYMKSSLTGDEDEVIREYRHGSPSFPHESTADQMFTEGQFEAYRSLGQHIGEQALRHLDPVVGAGGSRPATYDDLERWFAALDAHARAQGDARG